MVIDNGVGMTAEEAFENFVSDSPVPKKNRRGVGLHTSFAVADEVTIVSESAVYTTQPAIVCTIRKDRREVRKQEPNTSTPSYGTTVAVRLRDGYINQFTSPMIQDLLNKHFPFMEYSLSVRRSNVNCFRPNLLSPNDWEFIEVFQYIGKPLWGEWTADDVDTEFRQCFRALWGKLPADQTVLTFKAEGRLKLQGAIANGTGEFKAKFFAGRRFICEFPEFTPNMPSFNVVIMSSDCDCSNSTRTGVEDPYDQCEIFFAVCEAVILWLKNAMAQKIPYLDTMYKEQGDRIRAFVDDYACMRRGQVACLQKASGRTFNFYLGYHQRNFLEPGAIQGYFDAVVYPSTYAFTQSQLSTQPTMCQATSLQDYVSRMKPGQMYIYFVCMSHDDFVKDVCGETLGYEVINVSTPIVYYRVGYKGYAFKSAEKDILLARQAKRACGKEVKQNVGLKTPVRIIAQPGNIMMVPIATRGNNRVITAGQIKPKPRGDLPNKLSTAMASLKVDDLVGPDMETVD